MIIHKTPHMTTRLSPRRATMAGKQTARNLRQTDPGLDDQRLEEVIAVADIVPPPTPRRQPDPPCCLGVSQHTATCNLAPLDQLGGA